VKIVEPVVEESVTENSEPQNLSKLVVAPALAPPPDMITLSPVQVSPTLAVAVAAVPLIPKPPATGVYSMLQ